MLKNEYANLDKQDLFSETKSKSNIEVKFHIIIEFSKFNIFTEIGNNNSYQSK